jgi:hypothetical protein
MLIYKICNMNLISSHSLVKKNDPTVILLAIFKNKFH